MLVGPVWLALKLYFRSVSRLTSRLTTTMTASKPLRAYRIIYLTSCTHYIELLFCSAYVMAVYPY